MSDESSFVNGQALIADGTYATILRKWGVEAGAISTPAVNPVS